MIGINKLEKIKIAKANRITIQKDLISKNIVGVYEFFKVKDGIETCFYIGKSTNIANRLLGSSSGHIHMYINNDFSKTVPLKMKEYIDEGYDIVVKIIEVDYFDKTFSKAAHRLALVELQEIIKYQEKGQCLFQLPEGVGLNEERF